MDLKENATASSSILLLPSSLFIVVTFDVYCVVANVFELFVNV